MVAHANPDGQILGLTNTAPLGMAPLTEALSYDPDRDFTVLPWLREHLGRPFRAGDVLAGGRRAEPARAGRGWRT